MLVVMQEGAEEAQIQKVIDRLVALGFIVHRSSGVSPIPVNLDLSVRGQRLLRSARLPEAVRAVISI